LLWILLFVVIACFIVSLIWPSFLFMTAAPPGQYPIDAPRPTWSVTQSVLPYRPMDPDSDVPFIKDAKFRCGTSKTCPGSLATVNLDL